MKCSFILILLALVPPIAFAQNHTVIKAFNPYHVGFGQSFENNQYLDAIVNAGLVHPNGSLVGAIVDGKQANAGERIPQTIKPIPPDPVGGNFALKNAIIGLDENEQMRIFKYGDPVLDKTKFIWAFQNGPYLLIDDVNDHNPESTNKFIRTGLGYNDANELVFIKSSQPVSFYEFAQIFKTEGCKNAIYLDGNVEKYLGYKVTDKSTQETHEDPVMEGRFVLQFYHSEIQIINIH